MLHISELNSQIRMNIPNVMNENSKKNIRMKLTTITRITANKNRTTINKNDSFNSDFSFKTTTKNL